MAGNNPNSNLNPNNNKSAVVSEEEKEKQQQAAEEAKITSFKKRLQEQQFKIKSDKYAFLWAVRDALRDGESIRAADEIYIKAAQKALLEASKSVGADVNHAQVNTSLPQNRIEASALTTLNTTLDDLAISRSATSIHHVLTALLPPGIDLTEENWVRETTGAKGSRYAKSEDDLTHQEAYRVFLQKLTQDFAKGHATVFGTAVKDWSHEDIESALTAIAEGIEKEINAIEALKDDGAGVGGNIDDIKRERLRALAAKCVPADLLANHLNWLAPDEKALFQQLAFLGKADDERAQEVTKRLQSLATNKAFVKTQLKGQAAETYLQDIEAYVTVVKDVNTTDDVLIQQATNMLPLLIGNQAAQAKVQSLRDELSNNKGDASHKQNLQIILQQAAKGVREAIQSEEAAAKELEAVNKDHVKSLKKSLGSVQKNLSSMSLSHGAQFEAAKRADVEKQELAKLYEALTNHKVPEFGKNGASEISCYQAIIRSQNSQDAAEKQYYERNLFGVVSLFGSTYSNAPRAQEVIDAERKALESLGLIELVNNNNNINPTWQLKISARDAALLKKYENEQEVQNKITELAKKLKKLEDQNKHAQAGLALAASFSKAQVRPDIEKLDPTDAKASNQTIQEMARALSRPGSSNASVWKFLQNRRNNPKDIIDYVNTRELKAEHLWKFAKQKEKYDVATKGNNKSTATMPLSIHKECVANANSATKSASFEINGLRASDKDLPAEILRAGLKLQTFAELDDALRPLLENMNANIDKSQGNWFAEVDIGGTKYMLNGYDYTNSDGSSSFYINVIDDATHERKGVPSGSDLEKLIAETLVKGFAEKQTSKRFSSNNPLYKVQFVADYQIANIKKEDALQIQSAPVEKSRRVKRFG